MTKAKKIKLSFIFFWIVLITSFVFLATFLIVFANGYNLNTKSMHLQKTGIIALYGKTDNPVNVSVNNTEKSVNLPKKYSRLTPGRYNVKISKNNYQDWFLIVDLEGGQAISIDNITLFYKPENVNMATSEAKKEKIIDEHNKQKKDIVIKENELWYKGKIITRFSKNLTSAILDPESNHFFAQINDEIYVLDYDGKNNILLAKLTSAEPVFFYVDDKDLFFSQNEFSYKARVR